MIGMSCLAPFTLCYRNIIEKTHGELVADRRACHSESDEALLLQFRKAVENDWRKERQQTRQHQLRPVAGSIVIMALLGCALVIIILVSSGLSLITAMHIHQSIVT